ncbi:Integral membrane sensor signal transduction histidine kinase [Paraburkholderia piptadeniae]|uniref:histidine kinase n=1 Tax=Paraburkholderia piptadeniae TaxID=1701573 RepID=A0A1N7SSW0_9BURK|nr:ATP-binding protein [Paraburkholderia piptadeniae]SIT50406.1 Integral membrane sensor signal transduction histidine kinase [Paraburkholderia piptadeniae]
MTGTRSTSIRRRLMWLILVSVGAVWAVMFAWSFTNATREVDEWDDARLIQLAHLLIQLDAANLAKLAAAGIDVRNEYTRASPAVYDDSDAQPRYALFEMSDAAGRLIVESPGLASLKTSVEPGETAEGVHRLTIGGSMWLAYALRDSATGRTVRVLEPANMRSDLTTGVASRIARPMAIALPVLALFIWFSIGHSFRPLSTISKAVRTRDARNLDPIHVNPSPAEVKPLVDAINQLLARLQHSIMRERAFTADAAHELKTPLAAIKVQAQVALAAQDGAQRQQAMHRVVQGVDRSARLAEQLLLLARLDERETVTTLPVKLHEVASEAIAFRALHAEEKSMAIVLAGDRDAEVYADRVLARTLIDNLLDNAIKYGDVGGRVHISVLADAQSVALTVSDNGPGVSDEERLRLTDRFFRGSAATASGNGSGLGLSIVARIATHFDAQIHIGSGIGRRGLAVQIAFPRVQHARVGQAVEPLRP